MVDRAARHLPDQTVFDPDHGDRGHPAPAAVAAALPEAGTRDAAICSRYMAGETLSSIGTSLGLSVEGVRKIARRYGLDKTNAGLAVRKLSKARPRKSRPAWERVYGCSLLEFREATYEERMAYLQHRTNAKRKRVAWALTLIEWVRVWRSSGKWALRGQGPKKYGMTRVDPGLGLVAANVRIERNAASLRRAQARQAAVLKATRKSQRQSAYSADSRPVG